MPKSKKKHSKSWKKARRKKKALRENSRTMGGRGAKGTQA